MVRETYSGLLIGLLPIEFYSGGERLCWTPNTAWANGNFSQGVEGWGCQWIKNFQGNIRGKEGVGRIRAKPA